MKKKFEHQERRGLPGGPNEMFTYVTGVFSTEGYKRNSPDVNNPYNIIPSGNITMEDVDFPVHGVDNLGNEQIMIPGNDYQFPGDMVFETPMAQKGYEVPKRQGVRKNPDGTESTHLMATETLDGKNWFSFPTLFQDPDGTWVDMSEQAKKDWKPVYEEAKRRGEVIDFGTDKETAIKFGEGSWKPKMKRGGGLLTKTMKCNSCGWSWKAADGGNDVSTCHKCGGEALPKAQRGGDGDKKIVYVSDKNDPEYLKYVAHNKLYRKLKDHNRAAQKKAAEYNVIHANKWLPVYTEDIKNYKEDDEDFIWYKEKIDELKGVLAANGIDPNYLTDSKHSLDNEDHYSISDEDQASWDKAKELGLNVKWNFAGTDSRYYNPIVKRPQQIYIVDPSKVEKEIAPEQIVTPEAPIQTQEVQQNRKDQVQYNQVITGYKQVFNPETSRYEKVPVYGEQGYRARGSNIGENTTTQNNFKYGGNLFKAQDGDETKPWEPKPSIDPAMYVAAAKQFAANERKKQLTGEALKAHKNNPQFQAIQRRDKDIETLKGSGVNPARLYMKSNDQGSIDQYVEPEFEEQALNYLANPMTTLGYLARGEDLPNFVPDKGNVIDYAMDVINPFAYLDYADKAYDNLSNDEYAQAGFNLLAAIPFLPKGVKGLGKTPKQLPGSPNAVSFVDDVVDEVPKPWQMQELPGLHLQSTMTDGAISKIIEPKTGLINTEQALAIIKKESGGVDKVALIRQGLGDKIPKKMDYNEFRKLIQEQLIPLERQFATHSSEYGINRLGYNQENFTTNKVNGKTVHTLGSDIIENETLILGNKNKFGRGSSAHGNPEETLGHVHFLRDAESPDVLTVTQIQSDAFQGTHKIMPKNSKNLTALEKQQKSLARMEELQERNKAILNKMKTEGVDDLGLPVQDYQVKQFEDIVKAQERSNLFKKADIENFTQKQLLDKNHQERYLQEIVDYAGKRGDVNKVRVPTSETAAKVQGYSKIELTGDNTPGFAELQEKISIAVRQGNQKEVNELMKIHDKMLDTPYKKYSNEYQTILKKYSQQPKTIKKLFGKEPRIVTDSKGNTWYEFDIPENFKKGKGEIKAYKYGGSSLKAQFGIEPKDYTTFVDNVGPANNETSYLEIYKNYIDGVYDNTSEEKQAQKIYDKLNRVYYKEAKANNMTVPNYIMSNIISKSL